MEEMETMMYKSCIFDLDGTLTDTLDSLTFSVNLTMKEMGLPEITREQCLCVLPADRYMYIFIHGSLLYPMIPDFS